MKKINKKILYIKHCNHESVFKKKQFIEGLVWRFFVDLETHSYKISFYAVKSDKICQSMPRYGQPLFIKLLQQDKMSSSGDTESDKK